MSLFQIFNAFENYSFDVLFLALIVVILTSFVKRVIFQNKFKKIITFVPFILGVALQLGYRYIVIKPELNQLFCPTAAKMGIITGGVGTIYYVFYEQFIRGKRPFSFNLSQLAVEGILANVVASEKISFAAQEITSKVKSNLHDKGYCQDIIYEILSGSLLPGISKQDIALYSKLIISTLSVL